MKTNKQTENHDIKLLKAGCSHLFEFWIMRNIAAPISFQPMTTYFCGKCNLFQTEEGFDPRGLTVKK